MILKFIENIGAKTIVFFTSSYRFVEFFVFHLLSIFNPYSYTTRVRIALVQQVYYTSIVSVVLFSFIAFIFGTSILGILISFATEFNVELQIGSIIINFVVNDFAPLFTAFFIVFRSGIRLTHNITHLEKLVLPYLLSGIFSCVSLSFLFSLIMLSSAYIFIYLFLGIDFHTYKLLLLEALSLSNITILVTKSVFLGFFIMLIPIYAGLNLEKNRFTKQIPLLKTLIKVIFAIFFIEVCFLLLLSLLEM